MNTAYLYDRREIEFFLFELFRIQDSFLGRAPFVQVTRDALEDALDEAFSFAEELGTEYQSADRESCSLEPDGTVRIPSSFAKFYKRRQEKASRLLGTPEDAPLMVLQVLLEPLMGANPAFMTYAGFNPPARSLIQRWGTEGQKAQYLSKLDGLSWDACFCATEEEAGSDLTAAVTSGQLIEDDVYSLKGQKIFISAGMHGLTENTIYVVIGRCGASKAGSYGLSCFLVPRYWSQPDGKLIDNNVVCSKVVDKMGFKGCANTHLEFGSTGVTKGWLLGGRPHVALSQLTSLMQTARISTGLFGLGMASSAYLHALAFSRSRIQGRRFHEVTNMNARPVPIIEHADIQRMLLEMKAKVEGGRALIGRLTFHSMSAAVAVADGNAEAAARHSSMSQFYVPIVKAYVSDQTWRVCELAMQVQGGRGYLAEGPLEQYARDSKILSIWEGTNFIQAQDLVREKLRFGRGAKVARYYEEDIRIFLSKRQDHTALDDEFSKLNAALDAVLAIMREVDNRSHGGDLFFVEAYCTRILGMFAELTVAWMLLEAACVAERTLRASKTDDGDFYEGKIAAAKYFIHSVLPLVSLNAAIFMSGNIGQEPLSAASFGWTPVHAPILEEAGAIAV